jgi:hypothetical protein
MPKTNAENQAENRAKKKAAGLKPMLIWVKPEWKSYIFELLAKLRSK